MSKFWQIFWWFFNVNKEFKYFTNARIMSYCKCWHWRQILKFSLNFEPSSRLIFSWKKTATNEGENNAWRVTLKRKLFKKERSQNQGWYIKNAILRLFLQHCKITAINSKIMQFLADYAMTTMPLLGLAIKPFIKCLHT